VRGALSDQLGLGALAATGLAAEAGVEAGEPVTVDATRGIVLEGVSSLDGGSPDGGPGSGTGAGS
jgi:hypothetical protein